MTFPTGFDRAIAKEAGMLVEEAYKQFTQGAAWAIPAGYQNLADFFAKSTLLAPVEKFGFVAQNLTSGDVFVTFRGTQTLDNWLANLTFPQDPHPLAGEVERGFFQIYKQCSASVLTGVSRAAGTPKIYVSGHSLGGALATLATADLVVNGKAPTLYSFASPRVGNPAFSAKLNAAAGAKWRMANSEDIVTTLPLATVNVAGGAVGGPLFAMLVALPNKLDFCHVGESVAFTAHNGSIVGNHEMKTYLKML